MMVETILESPTDLGMSNGGLPQWKRELLQRRAARSQLPPRAPPALLAPPAPPALPPAPPEDDEELRYGPGIVKRLKSRYLSLALREAPRRRPSVLRRAASLEHLLEEQPAPRPARIQRPASVALAAAASPSRRDAVKRARSVDALSRLEDIATREPSTSTLADPAPAPPPPLASTLSAPAHPSTPAPPLLESAHLPPPAPSLPASALPPPPAPSLPASALPPPPAPSLSALPSPPAPSLSASALPSPPAPSLSAPALPPPPALSLPTSTPPPSPALSHPTFALPPPSLSESAHPPPRAPSLPASVHPPPAPSLPRTSRPPRRPTPLLRDAERPPADVVRSVLRKFESAPPRRTAPAARVSAVLRGLSARTGSPPTPASVSSAPLFPAPRCSTPEPRGRTPSPVAADVSAIDEPECPRTDSTRPVSRAALESIARAGSTQKFSFSGSARGSHLPPLPPPAATNPVMLDRVRRSTSPRRVGVIRPMPASQPERHGKPTPAPTSPTPEPDFEPKKRDAPSAAVEPRARSPPPEEPEKPYGKPRPEPEPLVNGHGSPPPSRISAANIERAWSRSPSEPRVVRLRGTGGAGSGGGGGTSIVFDFSSRKDVPDYIENDGLIMPTSRKDKLKAGDPGVVVLRPGAGADSDEEGGVGGSTRPPSPPAPCNVRFVNDNVIINGRSSMYSRPDRDRIAKLKLQFDDSLTRTFQYPSETSLCEEEEEEEEVSATPHLPHNTHLAGSGSGSGSGLNSYCPSKTVADRFQLGVTRPLPAPVPAPVPVPVPAPAPGCADRSFSHARDLRTDLLF